MKINDLGMADIQKIPHTLINRISVLFSTVPASNAICILKYKFETLTGPALWHVFHNLYSPFRLLCNEGLYIGFIHSSIVVHS